MSQVLSAIKQKYPAYANVPDGELALRLGQKYPVYLEQDSEFKSEFDQAIGTAKLPPSEERADFVQPEAKPTTDLGTFIQQPDVTGPTETNPRNLQVTPQAPEGNLSEPFNTQFPGVEPAQIGATPAQLPRFGKEGTVLRGASDIVSGLGEFAINKPEEFLASIYPPTQVAILMRYAPQMAKDFAVDAVKAAQGDGEAAGRATTMAALAALPFGIREVQKIRAREPALPSPDVERAAIEALSTRDRTGEVVEPTAPKNLAEALLPRSKAALEKPAKPEVENAIPIRSAETVPLEVPPETGAEVGAQVREQAPAETQAPKEAVEPSGPIPELYGFEYHPSRFEGEIPVYSHPDARKELSRRLGIPSLVEGEPGKPSLLLFSSDRQGGRPAAYFEVSKTPKKAVEPSAITRFTPAQEKARQRGKPAPTGLDYGYVMGEVALSDLSRKSRAELLKLRDTLQWYTGTKWEYPPDPNADMTANKMGTVALLEKVKKELGRHIDVEATEISEPIKQLPAPRQSGESKPLPPATEEAPRSEAPTEATVSPATSEGVTAPPEPQAIPETTASAPTGQTGGVFTESQRKLVKAAFPKSQISEADLHFTDATSRVFDVELLNGRHVLIDPNRETIVFDIEKSSRESGIPKEKIIGARGKYRSQSDIGQSGIGLIELKKDSDAGTLSHEKFHALFDLALDKRTKSKILSRYGNEEKAAEAFRRYEGFDRGWIDKMKGLASRLRNIISGDVFKEIERPKLQGQTAKPEVAYDASLEDFRNASRKFSKAQADYRSKKIGDAEFLAASEEFKKAQDVADVAERTFIEEKNKEGANIGPKEARQQNVARVETPPQAVTKAQQKVAAVAKSEGQRPAKEIKNELVDRLERAIDVAPAESEVGQKTYTKANMERVTTPDEATKITIEIPGDGVFTIRNTKEALTEILKRAKKISTSSEAKTTIPKGAVQSSEKALRNAEASKAVELQKNIGINQESARGRLYDAINKGEEEGIAGRSKEEADPQLDNGVLWREWRIRKATPAERQEHFKGTKSEIRWVGERRVVKFSKEKGRTENEWLFDDSGKTRADVIRGMEANMPRDAVLQDEGLKAWRDLENMSGSYSFLKEGKEAPASPVDKFISSIETLPEGKAPKEAPPPLGITPSPIATDVIGRVLNVGKALVRELREAPKFKPFKEAINAWNGKNQMASLKIRKLQSNLESKVKDPVRREAISNWIQADGDPALLQSWEVNSKNAKRRAGYKAARSLTPDEIKVAQSVRQLYDDLLARAKAYGVVEEGINNYVTQVWKQPVLRGSQMVPFMTKLARNFKFGQKRTFENFFEGESLGYKPVTKDISKLLGLYMAELEKTIATRDLIKDLTTKLASDGNPLAKPEGVASIVESLPGDPAGPMFVKPGVVTGDVRYQQIDHPALAKWKWVNKDPETGRDVFMLGELRAHPEIASHLRKVLSQSGITRWMREPSQSVTVDVLKAAARAGDTFSRVTKEIMLGTLSTFHHVQEGTHAVGHRINPFFPEKMPIETPAFQDALFHGLQVAGDRAALESFREGLGARDVFEKVGAALGPLGRKAAALFQANNDFLFNEYIPRLKWATYQSILDRNMARFAPEMRSGRIAGDDVKYLSALQTNAAYGHLNYADLGRDPTVQHVLRLAALAPDFLEARSRFAGQAAKGVVSKAGREQLEAISLLAATFYVSARILNQLSTGEWNNDEPFGVRIGNRTYRMRSVPEDIWRLFHDSRRFVYGRLNPVFGRGTVELLTGKNFRGENIPASETFKDILTSWIPIQARNLPGLKNLSETQRNSTINAWESFLGSIGIQVSRYSVGSKINKLAKEWERANGQTADDRATYPTSKYQALRYALEDRDLQRAVEELSKLEETMSSSKIESGFHESLFRPFTGSLAKERAFKRSLDAEKSILYRAALDERSRIWSEFKRARRQR